MQFGGRELCAATGARLLSARGIGRSLLCLRRLLIAGALMAGASFADPLPAPDSQPSRMASDTRCRASDVSVMTYNVAGLPWPLAKKGPDALTAIGKRLARLRARGCAPAVVVLQEAFSDDAKAIGRIAGYKFLVEGPYLRSGTWPRDAGTPDWTLGETAGTPVGSGLIVMSDLPVAEVRRAAFPQGACAGLDCLAAKGVLLVTLELPGGRNIMVADTHLNSKGASGAAASRTQAAYQRQADFLAQFLRESRDAEMPLVIAGDFNRGQRAERTHALQSALERLAGAPVLDGLRTCMIGAPAPATRSADARTIAQRARDMQYAINGTHGALRPVGADIPFGTESDGSMLSDHIGYTIHYAYVPGLLGS
jgi:Metal-dependent hydrolase